MLEWLTPYTIEELFAIFLNLFLVSCAQMEKWALEQEDREKEIQRQP